MSGEERSLHDIWAALSLLTRRLDDLAGSLARLDPTGMPPAPDGEPLDEPTRARLAGLESLLALGPHLVREEALLLAVDRVIHRAGADCAAILLVTPEGELEVVAGRGLPAGGLRIPVQEGIVGRAFRERETIRAGPAHQMGDRLLRDHALVHALALPIRPPERPAIGVVFAGRRRPVAFGPEALEAMALVADRVALTLAAATAPPAPAWPAASFAGELDLGRAAAGIAREAAVRLGATRVAVLLPDDGGLRLAGAVGVPEDAAPPDPAAEPIATALRGGRVWMASAAGGDETLARFLGVPPQLVLPLAVAEHPVGVLVVGGPSPLAPAAIRDLLPLAAVTIRNARLYADTVAALAARREAERGPAAPPPQPVRDFANLLAVVLARIGLARERVGDASVGTELEVAEEAAWRAAEAVRGFLGFAPGHRDAPLVPLDLGLVLREAVEGARHRWATREGSPPSVTVDLEPIPPIRGRADDLHEALDQLLENAAEAVPAGGVITVRARWDGDRRIEVLLEDGGAGMEEAVRARALEPFFSTKGSGRLGLGLPVAQAITAHHQGTLDLVSMPQAGTTVRLTFPTAGSGTGGRRSPAREAAPARVLVVEAEAAVRETITAFLGREGLVVLTAADAQEGLAIVQREPIDVVFTSLAVPGASGLEIAAAVKRLRPETAVILLTAWPGRLDEAAVRESGIERVIEKPAGLREVLAALDAALALRRTIRP